MKCLQRAQDLNDTREDLTRDQSEKYVVFHIISLTTYTKHV